MKPALIKSLFTAKEIREKSPAWLRFIINHDRALLKKKIEDKSCHKQYR